MVAGVLVPQFVLWRAARANVLRPLTFSSLSIANDNNYQKYENTRAAYGRTPSRTGFYRIHIKFTVALNRKLKIEFFKNAFMRFF